MLNFNPLFLNLNFEHWSLLAPSYDLGNW